MNHRALYPRDLAYPGKDPNGNEYTGLTVREYFAALAMQGLLSQPAPDAFINQNESISLAREAVLKADALIEALNES
jgi:hypothetical protein